MHLLDKGVQINFYKFFFNHSVTFMHILRIPLISIWIRFVYMGFFYWKLSRFTHCLYMSNVLYIDNHTAPSRVTGITHFVLCQCEIVNIECCKNKLLIYNKIYIELIFKISKLNIIIKYIWHNYIIKFGMTIKYMFAAMIALTYGLWQKRNVKLEESKTFSLLNNMFIKFIRLKPDQHVMQIVLHSNNNFVRV
jgi:hypothetical protein